MPSHKPRKPSPKYLMRYECPALVEEEKRWRQAWRTEEDHLLFIQQVADPDMSPRQIARALGITEEHAEYLVSVAHPSKEQFRRYRWLTRFEGNQIDPFDYGHA